MSANFAYKNTRDYQFILKEWLPLEEVLTYPQFKDYYSIDDVEPILNTFMKMCKEVIEPTCDDGEINPVRFENGEVILPPTIGPTLQKLQQDGWGTSNIDRTPGAMVLPNVIHWMLWEMVTAANPQLPCYYGMCAGSADLIQAFADENVKEMFLPKMFDGTYTGTMCLTEPSAGSDVGDILSKAYPTDNPRIFKIKGQKIFITNGDNNYSENIVHLYLARVEGALPGTKGISLFVVPKYWINEDGTTEFNDVVPTGVEEKMGQHGNATVSLSFGDNDNCRGWLMGQNPLEHEGRGKGMAQMFLMMNQERLGTGLMATGLVANSFLNAADYARERVQGFHKPEGRTTLDKQEDIKRAILAGQSHVDAMRAMIYKTYLDFDKKYFSPDGEVRKAAADEFEVNIPICKAYASEECWGLIAEAIQIYGGYGYCEDYPVAKMARDSKVYSIWEGTNYIQSMDLIGRKWRMENGAVFARWLQNITDFYEENKDAADFEREFKQLDRAIKAYQEIQMAIVGFIQNKQMNMIPVYSKRILMATAQLYGGQLLLEQALLANGKAKEVGPGHHDYTFYSGRVQSARYYLNNVVPNVAWVAELLKSGDTSVLDIDFDYFDY
ncbi:MAG TPA: acyl-CoA dehydrogenase [Syntrophomonadaceae bacterium]|nr:acyl-CoA dehydrogenase [Syntrophomonadaceae bacterium]